jgi:hypothetical protein
MGIYKYVQACREQQPVGERRIRSNQEGNIVTTARVKSLGERFAD